MNTHASPRQSSRPASGIWVFSTEGVGTSGSSPLTGALDLSWNYTGVGSGPNHRTVAIGGLPKKARWRTISL